MLNREIPDIPSLIRLFEETKIPGGSDRDGLRSLVEEPPLPLFDAGRFSLEPDLALGWKPSTDNLVKVPSLPKFKSAQDRMTETLNAKKTQSKIEKAQADRLERQKQLE